MKNNPIYRSTKDTAKEWNVSERRIRQLCKEERIDGILFIGGTWLIPSNAKKPKDLRFKNVDKNEVKNNG